MKTFAILFLTLLVSGSALAQPVACPSSVYFEALGNGLLYSVNYDRLLTRSLGARVGVSHFAPDEVSVTTFPMTAYCLVGSGNHKLELGLGACVMLQGDRQSFSFMSSLDEEFKGNGVLGTATLGYRHQHPEGGFVFRAGVTPFFGTFERDISPTFYETVTEDVFRVHLSGGMSAGVAF